MHLIIGTIDIMRLDVVMRLLIQNSQDELFLDLELYCSRNNKEEEREALILSMFIEAASLNRPPILLHLITQYESIIT